MGIRTDLLVTEEIAESSDLRATPFEFERAKRVEAALSILEGKWKIVILNRLFARPIWRFSELERAVPGISQRMLSQQLRLLEKCELVKRTVHPQFPPKVEYELTEFGKTLRPAMKTLVDWAMTFPKTRETSRYGAQMAKYFTMNQPPHVAIDSAVSVVRPQMAITRLIARSGIPERTASIPSEKAYVVSVHLN